MVSISPSMTRKQFNQSLKHVIFCLCAFDSTLRVENVRETWILYSNCVTSKGTFNKIHWFKVHSSSLTFSDETITRRDKKKDNIVVFRIGFSFSDSYVSAFELHIKFKITWIKIYFQLSNYIQSGIFYVDIWARQLHWVKYFIRQELKKNGSDKTLTSNLDFFIKVIEHPLA